MKENTKDAVPTSDKKPDMYPSLYSVTGDIKDVNNVVVPHSALHQLLADAERLDFLIKHGYCVYQCGNNATYHRLTTLDGRDEWCELRCDDPRDLIDFVMQQMRASA